MTQETNHKAIKLSERQQAMIHTMRELKMQLWIGAVNRRTANNLIERGFIKMDREGNLKLTPEGKNIKFR